jgi:hypothetical protein
VRVCRKADPAKDPRDPQRIPAVIGDHEKRRSAAAQRQLYATLRGA